MPDLFVQFHFIESWTEQHVDPLPVFLHSDDGPGSLREGCRRKEPLWIVFEISGTIHLSSYLSVSSHKTIDGRGQRIKLTGKGLRLKECENIIICNLEFEGGRGHDVDGIQIKPNSRNIWIDRCSLRDYDDGLIDITRQSTDITISRWVHFSISISNWSDWSNVLCCECDVILFLFFCLWHQMSLCTAWQDHAHWSWPVTRWWSMHPGDDSSLFLWWNTPKTASCEIWKSSSVQQLHQKLGNICCLCQCWVPGDCAAIILSLLFIYLSCILSYMQEVWR